MSFLILKQLICCAEFVECLDCTEICLSNTRIFEDVMLFE